MRRRTMRRLAIFLIVCSVAVTGAGAGQLRLVRYAETVRLGEDGSAGIGIRFVLSGGTTGDTLLLPYAASAWPESLRCSAPVDTLLPRKRNGHFQGLLVLKGTVAPGDTLAIDFTLRSYAPFGIPSEADFGNYVIEYRVVHALADPIDRFVLTMILPPGFVVNNVRSTSPAQKANSPNSPYLLTMEEGRHSVVLTAAPVEQGDAVALGLEVKRRNNSPIFIGGLVVLAVAYLIGFRDLLIPSRAKEEQNGSAL
jgi:hypothetical protein